MGNHNDSVSCLDEELFSVLINLQNVEPNTQHEIGNSIVRSKGLSKKATVRDEGHVQVYFILKRFLILAKRCFERLRFKF